MGILLGTRRPPGKTFIRSSVLPDRFRLIDATSKWRRDAAGGEPGRCADATGDNIMRTIAAWSADWRCTTIITNEKVTWVRTDHGLPAAASAEMACQPLLQRRWLASRSFSGGWRAPSGSPRGGAR